MATLTPNTAPSKANPDEAKIFNLLKKLPKDCNVFFEPIIRGKTPDFVVVSPRTGVAIIEVKSWEISKIESVCNDSVHLKCRAKIEERKNPTTQARQYMFDLMNLLKKSKKISSIGQEKNSTSNGLPFPMAYIVMMPNIKKSDIVENNLSSFFSQRNHVFSEEMEELLNYDANKLENFLSSKFLKKWAFKTLKPEETQLINNVIHPIITLGNKRNKEETAIETKKSQKKQADDVPARNEEHTGEYIPSSVYSIVSESFTTLIDKNLDVQKKIVNRRKEIEDIKRQIEIANLLTDTEGKNNLSKVNYNESDEIKSSKYSLSNVNCMMIENHVKSIKEKTVNDNIDGAIEAFEKMKLHTVTMGLKLEYIKNLESLLSEIEEAKQLKSRFDSVASLLSPEELKRGSNSVTKQPVVC